MTEEEKQPEAPNPEAPEESGQEAKAEEKEKVEDSEEEEKPEGKSMTLTEMKSVIENLAKEVDGLKKQNTNLKAIVEKAQHKSKGAEQKESKSQDQPARVGPLDMI